MVTIFLLLSYLKYSHIFSTVLFKSCIISISGLSSCNFNPQSPVMYARSADEQVVIFSLYYGAEKYFILKVIFFYILLFLLSSFLPFFLSFSSFLPELTNEQSVCESPIEFCSNFNRFKYLSALACLAHSKHCDAFYLNAGCSWRTRCQILFQELLKWLKVLNACWRWPRCVLLTQFRLSGQMCNDGGSGWLQHFSAGGAAGCLPAVPISPFSSLYDIWMKLFSSAEMGNKTVVDKIMFSFHICFFFSLFPLIPISSY